MAKTTIEANVCKGCGLCISVCPKKILELTKVELNDKGYHYSVVLDMDKCIACAMCAMMCPDSAITVEK